MSQKDTAVFRVHIKGSIEKVWNEITKTDEPQKAMFNSVMHTTRLEPGAPIRMRTVNGKHTSVVGEVIEIDPPHRFVHTMRFTNYDDPPCKITYELKEVAGGVEFTLTVDDIPLGTKSAKQLLSGGKFIVNTLKGVVENGKPGLGVRILYQLFKLLAPFSPAQTRSERWPLKEAR